MKLSRIPGIEPTIKQSFSFKKSTVELLDAYQQACCELAGVEVNYRDLVEQMLLDFMNDDKTFQRYLKERAAQAKKGSKDTKVRDTAEISTTGANTKSAVADPNNSASSANSSGTGAVSNTNNSASGSAPSATTSVAAGVTGSSHFGSASS